MRLTITDNAYGVDGHEGIALDRIVERPPESAQERCSMIHDLNIIGGKNLEQIIEENPDLLVFPHSLGAHGDDIGNLRICSYNVAYDRLYTGNLMGFVGVNETQLTIKSRFASDGDDYFLHYMLLKVFCPNVFKFKHESSSDSVFDFLLYLFPNFFNEAMRQGLFKEYRRFRRNDIKVKGSIDVARHISSNAIFNGRIAYDAREYTYDNMITQLLRHTIEFIKHVPYGNSILQGKETQANIRIIADVTQTYSHSDLRTVINANRRRLNHPYFTKYIPLQRLCVNILNRHKLKYGSQSDKVYGILFDGAWLWEEFLNKIFNDWGLIHAENKTGRNPIYLLKGNGYIRYPDFYMPGKVVIDAKYKRLNASDIARDDMHQIVAYLHVLNAESGYVAFPTNTGRSAIVDIGRLNGLGGNIGKIQLNIPQNSTSLKDFINLMDGKDGEISKIVEAWSAQSSAIVGGQKR